MLARTHALCAVALAGCAGAGINLRNDELKSAERSPGLFMGHSVSGDLVVAASHYDAMAGLATTDYDLGLPARKNTNNGDMLCQRQIPTGSHVPRWECRYVDETREIRAQTHDFLNRPGFSLVQRRGLPTLNVGSGPGGGNRGTITP